MSYEPMNANGLRRELEQANVNLNHHLEHQSQHAAEVERWQGIVKQLEETIQLFEAPASAIRKKAAPTTVKDFRGGPRIRWGKQWPIVLGDLAGHNIFPTKRELIAQLQGRYQTSEANANAAVNNAINRGLLLLKQDRCYLPTDARASAVA